MGNQEKARAIRDELESLAPNLARMKEAESKVDIPEGYFDQLSTTVFDRLRDEAVARPAENASWWNRLWAEIAVWWLQPSYAGALLGLAILLVGTVIFLDRQPEATAGEIVLSEKDVNDYINFHIDEFDLSLLAEESAEQSGESMIFSEEDPLRAEEMEDYLDEWLDEIELDELL